MRKTIYAVTAAAGFTLVAPPALATDRPATAEERTAIEKVLRAQAFTSWEEIEFDDGLWEVDDARTADGKEYDLKLDPKTLKIVKRTLDN